MLRQKGRVRVAPCGTGLMEQVALNIQLVGLLRYRIPGWTASRWTTSPVPPVGLCRGGRGMRGGIWSGCRTLVVFTLVLQRRTLCTASICRSTSMHIHSSRVTSNAVLEAIHDPITTSDIALLSPSQCRSKPHPVLVLNRVQVPPLGGIVPRLPSSAQSHLPQPHPPALQIQLQIAYSSVTPIQVLRFCCVGWGCLTNLWIPTARFADVLQPART